MDIETGAICAVLQGGGTASVLAEAVGLGLNSDLFDRAEPVWRFVVDYSIEHGGVPPEHVVAKRFPNFEIPQEKPAAVTYYIDELRKRKLHNMQADAMREAAKALKEKDPLGAFAVFEKLVAEAQTEARPSMDVNIAKTGSVRKQQYQERKLNEGVKGIRTPWDTLTEWTQGWQGGQYIVVAARTGTGKTWILDKVACSLHMQELVPFIASREMSVDEMTQRVDAIRARVSHSSLRSGELNDVQEVDFYTSLDSFELESDFWISGDDSTLGVRGLGAKIDRYDPAMVLIDGLYLMEDDRGETGWGGVKNVSNDLKKLARSKNIPILVTTQLNRGKGTKRDAGTDAVAYGDSISQDADVLIILFQDEDMRLNNELLVVLKKQRDGTSGEFMIRWDMATMDFSEVDGPEDGIDEDAELNLGDIPF